MLSFVGLGLYDTKSVTVRGAEVIREADFVFLENLIIYLHDYYILQIFFGKDFWCL